MERKRVTVKTKSFVRISERSSEKVIQVDARQPESVNYTDECVFYFFDSYVGVVDGVEYRFGPEFNVSQKYYRGNDYYPNPDHFRSYFMRCHGWNEEQIAKNQGRVFRKYNKTEYPNGVIIINDLITNPRDGTVLSAKETIDHEVFPSDETKELYCGGD